MIAQFSRFLAGPEPCGERKSLPGEGMGIHVTAKEARERKGLAGRYE